MQWLRETRIAARLLTRRPLFALTVLTTIALGIAATTAIFTVANAVLFRPLPFLDPDRVVHLYEAAEPAAPAGSRLVVRPGNYYDWKAQVRAFASMGAVAPRYATLAGNGSAELIWTHRVTDGLFETLGVNPLIGRTFALADYDVPDGAPVVVVSHHLWLTALGGASDIVGRRLEIDNRAHTVIGVMPPGFYPSMFGRIDAWLPLYIDPGKRASRVDWMLQPIARLRDGVTLEEARAELDGVARRVAAAYPIDGRPLTGATIRADDVILGPQRPLFALLLAASSLLLVIASVNVASLLLVRGVDRTRELTVQISLGASPWRLVRQAVIESTLLAFAGGLAGAVGASALIPAVLALLPEGAQVPRLEDVGVDATGALFAMLLSIVVGVVVGSIPAWITLRSLRRRGVRDSGPSVAGDRRSRRAHAALVVTQIAASIVLLLAAGIVLRSFVRLRAVDPGIRTASVLTVQLRAPASRYPTEATQWALFAEVESRLRALPGVDAVGLAASLPFEHGFNPWSYLKPGQTTGDAMSAGQRASIQRVSPGYFTALGMPLVAGRALTDADVAGRPRVMVINETMARHGWPQGNAVGAQVEVDLTNTKVPVTIVGVVRDARLKGPHNAIRGEMFWPLAQSTVPNVHVFVQSSTAALSPVSAAANEVRRLDQSVPVVNPRLMTRVFDDSLWRPRVASVLFSVFATIALTLASLGLYGVLAYSVTRRSREIGIRLALGDRPGRVLLRTASESGVLVLAGIAAGLTIATLAAPALRGLLGQERLGDPVAIAATIGILLATGMLAALSPAQRAARVDPATLLRRE